MMLHIDIVVVIIVLIIGDGLGVAFFIGSCPKGVAA
jgi:hypothetical protein